MRQGDARFRRSNGKINCAGLKLRHRIKLNSHISGDSEFAALHLIAEAGKGIGIISRRKCINAAVRRRIFDISLRIAHRQHRQRINIFKRDRAKALQRKVFEPNAVASFVAGAVFNISKRNNAPRSDRLRVICPVDLPAESFFRASVNGQIVVACFRAYLVIKRKTRIRNSFSERYRDCDNG